MNVTGDPVQYPRLLLVDRGIGLYERRAYTQSPVRYDYGFAHPRRQNRTEYLVVRGPVFLPDKVDERHLISFHEGKAEALAALEQLAQAQFHGKAEEASESSPQPHGKEISGHRASSMPRGSGILYVAKNRDGYDPRDFHGVIVVTDTGRPYWVSVWHRKVNGRAALEVQLSPKI
jgi:hypothetical protein